MAKITTFLRINQGYDFQQIWRWSTEDTATGIRTPVDLTGWTSLCKVRETPGPNGYVLASSLSITLGGVLGTITLDIPNATSWAWTWSIGFYEVALIDLSAKRIPFAGGQIQLLPGVAHV